MKTSKGLRKDIGLFIKKSRIDKSLTAHELGRLVNLSQQQVSRYELGITVINIEMLSIFLTALDKSWTDFFFSVIAYHSDDVNILKKYLF